MLRRLAVLLALGCALPSAGAAGKINVNRAVDGLGGSVDELTAWGALDDQKWIRARELGERIIQRDPSSYAGHYVLGVAMHYGEGDLARSALHLDRAMRLFEAKFGGAPKPEQPWRWHEATLKELGFTYGEMDKPKEELEIFDHYDRAYSPERFAQRVWPLMKLRRYDEAREMARRAVATDDRIQRMIARSDLCAAECEAGSREAAYKACTDALDDYRRVPGGQVEFSNASEAALSVFKYDQAEHFLSESTRRVQPDSWGNPFQHLATLYLVEGRIPEAIDALKGGQSLRLRRPAWLDQHGQARLDGTLAELLLVVGQTDRAALIARRAVDRPDRQGTQSGTEAQAVAAAALRLAVTLREQAERDREEASASGLGDWLKLRARAALRDREAWRERRRAAVLLADERFLVRSIRPYYVGGIDLPTWIAPELVAAVGSGVALSGIKAARAEEPSTAAAPFFDALEAEAEFQRGGWQAAQTAGERALAKLPRAEALLRGRVTAIIAEAARRRGELSVADAHFAAAMAIDPGVLRRLDIALPVRLSDDGTPIAGRAQSLLSSSPRLRVSARALFRVELHGGARPNALLLGPKGERLAAATLDDKQLKDLPGDDARARALVSEAQRALFAIKADLTQGDLTTLDGSPTAQRADKQVNSLLDEWGPSGK